MLSDTFFAAHGKNLEYDDMSLEFGGLFDLDVNFTVTAGHARHRCGQNVDLHVTFIR